MKQLNKMVAATAVALMVSAMPASAAIVQTNTAGTVTAEAGAATFNDFDAVNNTAIATVSGGQINLATGPGGGGNWLTTSNTTTPITVTFTGLVDYFGFLWGSQDSYNAVTLYNGATALGTFTASSTSFVNFAAGTAADYFDRAVLTSTQCCFETDNYAARLAGPMSVAEPATLGLLGFGMAGLGLALRRRAARRTD